jgi:hypothetical protein
MECDMNNKLEVVGKTSNWKTSVKDQKAPTDYTPEGKELDLDKVNALAKDAAKFPKNPFPDVKGAKKVPVDPISEQLDDFLAQQADKVAAAAPKEKKVSKGKKKFAQAPAWENESLYYTGGTTYGGGYGKGLSCYHTHPPLKFVAKDGIEYTIYGGNCRTPIVKDADIYIGFDGSVAAGSDLFPWDVGYVQPILVDYYITDMSAPKSPVLFHKLIDWTCEQLVAGKKIHAGCIGGHGRTGTFLSAVYAQMTGQKDAIQYVRKNYCEKAVESKAQIDFLMKNFGTSAAKPGKEWGTTHPTYAGTGKANGYQGSSGGKTTPLQFKDAKRKIAPVQSPKEIW